MARFRSNVRNFEFHILMRWWIEVLSNSGANLEGKLKCVTPSIFKIIMCCNVTRKCCILQKTM